MRRSSARIVGWGVGALALTLVAGGYAANHAQARQQLRQKAELLTGGDVARGKALVSRYGCGGCHAIPGVPQASGQVGPPLRGIGGRIYIAGRLENRPENLKRWIESPRVVDSETAMPPLGVSHGDARDIAAFLYTL